MFCVLFFYILSACLHYIENSNREKSEGWYSFEYENGSISKQQSSFSDLSIVVLSKTNNTHINLVDKATNTSTDTNITDTEDALFDAEMYGVGAYRYTLPGEYFEKNYTADADTNLYLRVENDGEILDLGRCILITQILNAIFLSIFMTGVGSKVPVVKQ